MKNIKKVVVKESSSAVEFIFIIVELAIKSLNLISGLIMQYVRRSGTVKYFDFELSNGKFSLLSLI